MCTGIPSSLSHRDPIGLLGTMKNNEALHMCELRTMPQGHPDYRFICHEMWRKIQEVHLALADAGRFIEWKKYRLRRLQSEMRTEFEKSKYKK